jgi:hypothetical protein
MACPAGCGERRKEGAYPHPQVQRGGRALTIRIGRVWPVAVSGPGALFFKFSASLRVSPSKPNPATTCRRRTDRAGPVLPASDDPIRSRVIPEPNACALELCMPRMNRPS